jgi:hypothetical protein
MILDNALCFNATPQAISGATTTVATDHYDAGSAVRLESNRVSTAVSAVGGTSPTLDIEVFGDSTNAFSSEKSVAKRSIAAADLVVNKVYHLDIPPVAPFRFYRVKYTQAGTSPTATVQSFLADEDLNQTDVLLAGVGTP